MTSAFLALLPGFMIYSFAMAITPGPNNLMLIASGANFGLMRTVPHILGITFGFALLFLVVGLGLGALFQAYPLAQTLLKVMGFAYILWLSWKVATASGFGDASAKAAPFTALQAAAFQWVNVKAWMSALSAFGVYTTTGGRVFVEAATLSTLTLFTTLPAVIIWAAMGAGLRRFLEDPQKLRLFNIAMAALLVLSLLPILL